MTASFLVFPTFLIFFVCSSFIYALPYTTFLLSTHLQANRPPIFFSTFLLLSEETVCFLSFSLFFSSPFTNQAFLHWTLSFFLLWLRMLQWGTGCSIHCSYYPLLSASFYFTT